MTAKPSNKPAKKKTGSKAGKPRKLNAKDVQQVIDLAAMGHTAEEIGPLLNIHPTAITTTYRTEYLLGMSKMKTSLRRAQFKKAVEDGHPTLLIWLGKQHLDQTDLGPLNPGDDTSEVEMTITTVQKTKVVKIPDEKEET